MTSFEYIRDIPFATNNPSADQPNMQINNNNAQDIWTQDHVGFNAANGGTHIQNSYQGFSPGNLLSGTNPSTAYPAAGISNTGNAQYWFSNVQQDFPINCVRAFGSCSVAGSVVTLNTTSWNVVSVTRTSAGIYAVTLKSPGVVSTLNFIVLGLAEISTNFKRINNMGYGITGTAGAGTFNLLFASNTSNAPTDPLYFSFAVLEI